MSLLSAAHLVDDINQSFLPALLPLIIINYRLSLQAAGTLVLAQAISSSVIQPAIGQLADKRPLPWLIGVGLLLAGGGIATIGLTRSYTVMFVAALVSGVGVAMFHPEAARFANYVAGTKKASGMRWFALGGNAGFAIGPTFATVALATFGLRGTWLAVLPVALVAIVVFIELPRLHTFLPAAPTGPKASRAPDDWGSFGKLTGFIVLRSIAYVGLVAYTPLYFIGVVHTSHALANIALTTFLIAGMGGTIAGGAWADRLGRRAVLLLSTVGSAALVVLFVAITVNGAPVAVAFIGIAAIGFVLVASQTAFVVLGQEYLPNRLGIASGVTLGLAVSLGGVFSPVLGALGDRYGIAATIGSTAVLCALASAVGLLLPPRSDQRMPGKASAASAA